MDMLKNIEVEATDDDNFRFIDEMPTGPVRFAEVGGGLMRNKLTLAIEADGELAQREFCFLAEDGPTPEGARFVDAHKSRGADNPWVIFEIVAP